MLINGEWQRCPDLPTSPVYNSSTGEVIAEAPLGGAETVDEAVQAARAAFPAWAETPAVERARLFFRYRTLLERDFDELAALITREHGKTLAESRGSVFRGLESVEYACGIPSLIMGETIENLAAGIDCEVIRQPLGVCAGITPYNFPVMVPLWMFPLALACGNTFILKPSEKVPLSAVRIIELLVEAGLPKGLLNLVHGGRETVDAILSHPTVEGISFVGSTPVARHIFETGTRNGKRVQANGGAKNFVIVMPDADIDQTVDGLVGGAFGCAGQRCMASSSAITVGKAADLLLPPLVKAAQNLRLGPTDRDSRALLGPVVTAAHRERINRLVTTGSEEGAVILADGRSAQVVEAPNGFYVGATVVDRVESDTTLAREAVFGPVLNVMRADSLEEALDIANRSAFGNGAAIFTGSGRGAREFKHRVKAGMVGINVGVPAPMAMFPFSGWDDSFFGDLHIQGRDAVAFYTRQKVVTSRWFAEGEDDVWKK